MADTLDAQATTFAHISAVKRKRRRRCIQEGLHLRMSKTALWSFREWRGGFSFRSASMLDGLTLLARPSRSSSPRKREKQESICAPPYKAGERISALVAALGHEVAPNTVASHLKSVLELTEWGGIENERGPK